MGSRPTRWARILAVVFGFTTVGLAVALAASWMFFNRLALRMPVEPPPEPTREAKAPVPVSPLLVTYQLDMPGRGEIFPALTASSAQDYWPVAMLSITNQSDRPVLQVISAQVPGWSRVNEQSLVVGPRETRMLALTPELLPSAYANEEVRRANLVVRALDPQGGVAFAQSRPVLLHSASDLYWGKKFSNAQYVARWVTPHDPAVLKLVADARQRAPGGRLRGYNAPPNATPQAVAQQVRREVQAVFDALRDSGLSYVSSIYTFGDHVGEAQRIRLPSETLALSTANCIDVSVAFASAMENLGMRPVVIIVPGHAFAGVRLGPTSEETLYVDLTVLPRGTLKQAITRAQSWMKKFEPQQVLTVDVAAARVLKIYPLPRGEAEGEPAVATTVAPSGPERSRTAE